VISWGGETRDRLVSRNSGALRDRQIVADRLIFKIDDYELKNVQTQRQTERGLR
jgi:hypothetical protein